MNSIGAKTVAPGDTLSFTISSSNPDGNNVSYDSTTGTNIYSARNAMFISGTRQFSWSPSVADIGTYQVTFSVTNLDVSPNVADNETITISVQDTTIAQGETLYITHCQSCHGVNGRGGSQSLVAGVAPLYVRTALGLTGNGLVSQMNGITINDADATLIGFFLCNLEPSIDYTNTMECPL